MQHIYIFSLRIYNFKYMFSYANSMTAPLIPPSAIQSGETDMQVTGLLVHIPHCSFRRFICFFFSMPFLAQLPQRLEVWQNGNII
jgi:hypothetical protein